MEWAWSGHGSSGCDLLVSDMPATVASRHPGRGADSMSAGVDCSMHLSQHSLDCYSATIMPGGESGTSWCGMAACWWTCVGHGFVVIAQFCEQLCLLL
jgi:hypothetical protein